jgi:hypothetical protein
VVVIALPMLFLWIQGTLKKLESIESIDLGFPQTEIIEEVLPEGQPTENFQEQQGNGTDESQNQINSEIINQQ